MEISCVIQQHQLTIIIIPPLKLVGQMEFPVCETNLGNGNIRYTVQVLMMAFDHSGRYVYG